VRGSSPATPRDASLYTLPAFRAGRLTRNKRVAIFLHAGNANSQDSPSAQPSQILRASTESFRSTKLGLRGSTQSITPVWIDWFPKSPVLFPARGFRSA
jgi:hypothetical protein